jgi:hypothetical protein
MRTSSKVVLGAIAAAGIAVHQLGVRRGQVDSMDAQVESSSAQAAVATTDAAQAHAHAATASVSRTPTHESSPPGTRAEQASSPAVPYEAAHSTSQVAREHLEAYFQRAPANFPAERAMLTYLHAQPLLKELKAKHEVHCHGWLCKMVLELETPSDAARLTSMPRPTDVDVWYTAQVFDLKRTVVTAFSALQGAKLEELIASSKSKDGLYSQEAALARATEVEARWRAGAFGSE